MNVMNVLITIVVIAAIAYVAVKAFFGLVVTRHKAAKARVQRFTDFAISVGVKVEIRSRADLRSLGFATEIAACFIPAAANGGIPMILVSRELMWLSISSGALEHEFQHALQDKDGVLRPDEDTLKDGIKGYFDNPIEKEAFTAQWASLPTELDFHDWYARQRAFRGDGSTLIHIKNPVMRLGHFIIARTMRAIVKI